MATPLDTNPLSRQVGGTHYTEKGLYQPWVIWEHWPELGVYALSALKYILRRKGDRKVDLGKAHHCLTYQYARLCGPRGRWIHLGDSLLALLAWRKGCYTAEHVQDAYPELTTPEVHALHALLAWHWRRSARLTSLSHAIAHLETAR